MNTSPLILTLTINKEAYDYFTALRDKHFPPERNYLKAHLTLFHHLPKDEAGITATLTEISLNQKQLQLEVSEVISIGNGVAYKIISEELQQLHRLLQQKWQPFLIPQDKQKLRPHITIQNKVNPAVARELKESLQQDFNPFTIIGTGFTLWEYMGGPWEFYKEFPFQE